MKKILIVFSLVVALVIILVITIGIYRFNFPNNDLYLQNNGGGNGPQINAHDVVFNINGEEVVLKNGYAETLLSADMPSKLITRYFGNDLKGDFNNNNQEDVIFILTQENEGTGLFYYVVAVLDGKIGTNAVLLGDRIAPQTINYDNDGVVVVNYADRNINEPFSVKPSRGVSKYLKIIDNQLTEINLPKQITNRSWRWLRTETINNEIVSPIKTDVFAVTLKEDGSVSGKTDCNNFFGSYEINDNSLSFGPLASTLMFCEGSQEQVFTNFLSQAESYLLDLSGNLIMELKMDAGVMVFAPTAQ